MPLYEDWRASGINTANVFRGQVGDVAVAPYATAALTKATLFNVTRSVPTTGTTSASAAITAPAGTFSADDVGAGITGTGIPASTTIISVQSGTAATMSANATATGSVTSTITPTAASLGRPKTLPTGWTRLGWTSTDGITQSRDTTVSDTPAWGASEPLVRVVTAVTKTLSVTALESNRTVDELYYMANLSGVVADASNIVNWQEADLPLLREFRLLAIAKFENAAGEWYEAVQYPRAQIQPNGDEVWDLGDNGNARPLLATAFVDGTLGYAVEHFKAGPGFNKTAAGYAT